MELTTVAPPPGETLVAKLARIANSIGEKEPQEHRNRRGDTGVKFPYHAAKDVYGWWREKLQLESIIVVPTKVMDLTVQLVELPRSGGGIRKTFLTTCVVEFTVFDGVTGEFLQGIGIGQGEDPADKGAGKAMTYAQKNFLLGFGMNGSEPDVEASDNDRADREYQASSRPDGRPDVVVTDSAIEGIQRGGRANFATDAQIALVKSKARGLNIGVRGIAEYVYAALGEALELPEDPAEAAPALSLFLTRLSSEDMGRVLVEMDRAQGGDDDDRGEPDDEGYG